MGNTNWDDLTGKKRWKKAHAEQKNHLYNIAKKYHLTKDTKPAHLESDEPYFVFDSFEYDAKNYADSKYAHTIYVSGWGVVAVAVITIVITIVSVLATPVTGGSSLFAAWSAGSISTGLMLAIVGGAALVSATLTGISIGISREANSKKIQEGVTKYRQSADGFKQAAKERSNTITTLMIYGKYEIYAGNSIYNQGRAGSALGGGDNSYTPSSAYDPTRGIRGDLSVANKEVDDHINYRAHTKLAGNRDFLQSMLGVDFPLQNSNLNYNLNDEQTQTNINNRLSEINAGFGELIDAQAGLEYTHSVDITSNPAKAYERIIKYEMGFYKAKLHTNDFLRRQEYYKNGQYANFEYLYFREESEQRESAMKNFIALVNDWDSKESQALRAQMSEKELVKAVIEMMIYSLEVVVDMLDGNVYEYRVELGYNKEIIMAEYKAQLNEKNGILQYFSPEFAKSALEVKTLFNYLIAWFDKSSLDTYNKQLEPPFSQDTINRYNTIEQISYSILKSQNSIYKNIEQNFKLKILNFFPPNTPQEYKTLIQQEVKFNYDKYLFYGNIIALESEGISEEFFKSLCSYKWDTRLDNVDLSKYTLEDLGLA